MSTHLTRLVLHNMIAIGDLYARRIAASFTRSSRFRTTTPSTFRRVFFNIRRPPLSLHFLHRIISLHPAYSIDRILSTYLPLTFSPALTAFILSLLPSTIKIARYQLRYRHPCHYILQRRGFAKQKRISCLPSVVQIADVHERSMLSFFKFHEAQAIRRIKIKRSASSRDQQTLRICRRHYMSREFSSFTLVDHRQPTPEEFQDRGTRLTVNRRSSTRSIPRILTVATRGRVSSLLLH